MQFIYLLNVYLLSVMYKVSTGLYKAPSKKL